jgi:chaperonin cofactor prefoldin
MIATNRFRRNGEILEQTPVEILFKKIEDLESRIKVLEEENVSTTNELYRMENSLDARIDIIAERCRIEYDV